MYNIKLKKQVFNDKQQKEIIKIIAEALDWGGCDVEVGTFKGNHPQIKILDTSFNRLSLLNDQVNCLANHLGLQFDKLPSEYKLIPKKKNEKK